MRVTPDVESIVEADAAAQREIATVQARLDERLRGERTRLEQARAADTAAAVARLDAEANAIAQETRARTAHRRAERGRARDTRRTRAADAVADAVAAYVAIVGGPEVGP